MNLSERSLFNLAKETVKGTGVRVAYREGQFVVSILDKIKGVIMRNAGTAIGAYKLALDMRDNRQHYVSEA